MKEFFDYLQAGIRYTWWVFALLALFLIIIIIQAAVIGHLKKKNKRLATAAQAPSPQPAEEVETLAPIAERQSEEQSLPEDSQPPQSQPLSEKDAAEQTQTVSQPAGESEFVGMDEDEEEVVRVGAASLPGGERVSVSKPGQIKFRVQYDRVKDSWVIRKDGNERVTRRVATKEEAMTVARELCKKYDAILIVHKKDGKFQKTR